MSDHCTPRRRFVRLGLVVPVVLAVSAVTATPAGAGTGPAAIDRPGVAAVATAAPRGGQAELESALREAFGKAADDVSVAVHDRRSGHVFTYNADLKNSTGSIVKVMVLVALVRDRRADGRDLSPSQKAMAERMIRHSDNDATTSLLGQAGGSAALSRVADAAKMSDTVPAGSWGRTSTTAGDQLKLMDAIVSPSSKLLTDADRDYVLGLMARVSPEQAWGVGKVPDGAKAGVKNGWVPLEPRGWRVNSVGHVTGAGRDYTMAVLSYDNASMEAGVRHMNDASRIVFDHLEPGSEQPEPAAGRAKPAALSQPRPLW